MTPAENGGATGVGARECRHTIQLFHYRHSRRDNTIGLGTEPEKGGLSMNAFLRPLRFWTLIAVAVALGLGLLSSGTPGSAHNGAVTTDKADYAPDETVIVTGSGFGAGESLDIPVIRPNGSIVVGDGSFADGWDAVVADGNGNFPYPYVLNGILGTYTVEVYHTPWGGPASGETPLASTTFTDADIDFKQCRNDSDNNNAADNCEWSTGSINQTNSFYTEGDSVPQRLLEKPDSGTRTLTFEYNFSKGGIYAYDFFTNVKQGPQNTDALLNACVNVAGFASAACGGIYGAAAASAIPSDPFDFVLSRENPPGAAARNFLVGCSPATSCSGITIS